MFFNRRNECLHIEDLQADQYLSWLQSKGFSSDSLRIGLDPNRGGYGVFTTRNIMKEEEILRIPPNLVLNRKSIIRLLSNKLEDTESEHYQLMDSFREAIVEIDMLSNHTNNDAHMISFLTLYESCFPGRLGYTEWTGNQHRFAHANHSHNFKEYFLTLLTT